MAPFLSANTSASCWTHGLAGTHMKIPHHLVAKLVLSVLTYKVIQLGKVLKYITWLLEGYHAVL